MLKFEPFYQEYERTLAAFQLAHSTIYFEQSTFAPKKGIPYSNEMLSRLSKQAFILENDPEMYQRIKEYYSRLEDSDGKIEVKKRLEKLENSKNIPSDVYAHFVKTRADSELAWHEAKETNDYELFKPHLQAIMEEKLELTEKYNPKCDGRNTYDVLLNEYEPGLTQKEYDEFFNVIKEKLVPFIQKIKEKPQIDDSILHQNYDVERQKKFMNKVLEFLRYDPSRAYIETTEHPFTHGLSHNDLRITTHYYENDVTKAVISTIHEFGHALYTLQMNADYEGTLLTHCGAAAQESQSRLLENYIGRSKAFWQVMYPDFVQIFPEFMNISVDDFYKMLNKVECSLVRTKADELTYPLHILIRYELEKDIANHKIDYDKLPELWADKYEEYLGVRPQTYSEGVLQDMHWSSDFYAYFATYALGSAYAAQIYASMEKEMDVKSVIKENHFDKIAKWLEDNVHHYGATLTMAQIVEKVSGEPFNPKYYIDYLIKKYSEIYNI